MLKCSRRSTLMAIITQKYPQIQKNREISQPPKMKDSSVLSINFEELPWSQIEESFQPFKTKNKFIMISLENLIPFLKGSSSDQCLQADQADYLIDADYLTDLVCSKQFYWKCQSFTIEHCFSHLPNTVKVIEHLSASCRFLTELNLSHNFLGDKGARSIQEAGWIFIGSLELGNTRLTHRAVQILSQNQWKYLKCLDLSGNPIGNKGLKILVQSETWTGLQKLSIVSIGMTTAGLTLFRKQGWDKLESIRLGGFDDHGTMLKIFSECHFPNLNFIYRVDMALYFSEYEAKMETHPFKEFQSWRRPIIYAKAQRHWRIKPAIILVLELRNTFF